MWQALFVVFRVEDEFNVQLSGRCCSTMSRYKQQTTTQLRRLLIIVDRCLVMIVVQCRTKQAVRVVAFETTIFNPDLSSPGYVSVLLLGALR